MSRAAYPRNRVRTALLTAELPSCFRIVPRRHLVSPLGTVPSDSRFCSRTADYTVLYAAPDFITAFVETVLRDRFTRRRDREIALREVTERACILYGSRLTGGDVYAVFDRGIGKLRAAETGTLADHPELPDVLAEHALRLVLQR